MYIIINYNMYTICIRNTSRSKLIPLLCTHVYSYIFRTVHPPGNVSYPRRLGVMRVRPWAMRSSLCEGSRMLKNTSSKVWAWRHDNLCGAMSQDIALQQKWLGSGSQDCRSLNKHNFLDTFLKGASDVSIGIYKEMKYWGNGCPLDSA